MAKSLSKKDKQGILLIVGTIVLMMALGGAQCTLKEKKTDYDETTLCPKNRPYPQNIVLIDKTDPLSPTQKAYLKNRLLDLRGRMRQYEKLTIMVLEDEKGAGVAKFAMCNPGSGREANELYQNPKLMQMHYEEQFGAPLEKILDDLLVGQTRPRSAIMEAIQDIAALPEFREASTGRHLFIYSDMVQNVPDFSQYTKVMPFEAFKKTSYGDWVLRTSLMGADVSVTYLLRPQYKQVQTRAHAVFWEKYFRAIDATLIEVDPVQ